MRAVGLVLIVLCVFLLAVWGGWYDVRPDVSISHEGEKTRVEASVEVAPHHRAARATGAVRDAVGSALNGAGQWVKGGS